MARPLRPEPIVLGLSLVALGLAWILGNAGRIDLLSTLRAWWPVTLILWGALELAAVALDRRARRS